MISDDARGYKSAPGPSSRWVANKWRIPARDYLQACSAKAELPPAAMTSLRNAMRSWPYLSVPPAPKCRSSSVTQCSRADFVQSLCRFRTELLQSLVIAAESSPFFCTGSYLYRIIAGRFSESDVAKNESLKSRRQKEKYSENCITLPRDILVRAKSSP